MTAAKEQKSLTFVQAKQAKKSFIKKLQVEGPNN